MENVYKTTGEILNEFFGIELKIISCKGFIQMLFEGGMWIELDFDKVIVDLNDEWGELGIQLSFCNDNDSIAFYLNEIKSASIWNHNKGKSEDVEPYKILEHLMKKENSKCYDICLKKIRFNAFFAYNLI